MTRPVRVGIAGLGRSGWGMHAGALSVLNEQYEVSAVTDPDPERRREAEERFSCSSAEDFTTLLSADTELIVVASPSHLHAEHTVAALEAGKHVIVEKPMAQSTDEADRMMAAARDAERTLTVNQNYRYKPTFRKVKAIIDSGILGQTLQVRVAVHQFSRRWDWQTLKAYNGGILANHGAHVVDWALGLFEDEDPELFSFLTTTPLYAGDADSHAKLIINPKDGPLLDVELTHSNAYAQPYWLVMGTRGSLSGSHTSLRWSYFDPAAAPPLELDTSPTPDRSYNSEKLPMTEETVSFTSTPNEDMLLLYRDLFATLRNGAPVVITPESVRRQMRLFERIRETAAARGGDALTQRPR